MQPTAIAALGTHVGAAKQLTAPRGWCAAPCAAALLPCLRQVARRRCVDASDHALGGLDTVQPVAATALGTHVSGRTRHDIACKFKEGG